MTNEILNVRDLQKYLKIGRDKAYSLMKTKGFLSIKIGGQYIVREKDLDEYLNKFIGREIII